MLAQGSHKPAGLRYPNRKKSIEVRSGKRRGQTWKPPYPIVCSPNSFTRSASLMMFCAQAHRHVATVRSGAEKSVLILAFLAIRCLFVQN
ncbi:hypothetical protein AVEN_51435-1 [Araneus ventricosus]|uniref:Uncharacterized protein n=1 Tax=Araneus ventricosus TaxID=182803 RepID=A0A4Y2G6U8_ARAVE|nr:hypothetical protein AVEN_51435-1 [Araneus ventricosus]